MEKNGRNGGNSGSFLRGKTCFFFFFAGSGVKYMVTEDLLVF